MSLVGSQFGANKSLNMVIFFDLVQTIVQIIRQVLRYY